MTRIRTPSDLALRSRDLRFTEGEAPLRWWLDNDPVATAFFNAFSSTFPQGERFFIDSVRRYRNDVPAALAAQIAEFVKQEHLHTREHALFNRQAEDQGYDLSSLEARSKARTDFARQRPAEIQVLVTAALEHFTAILAHALLAHPQILRGGQAHVAQLWRWHSIEEIEHKAVAYDTFLWVTRDWPALKRWRLRTRVMLFVTLNLVRNMSLNVAELLRQDGLEPRDQRGRALAWLFVRPGLLRLMTGQWLAWFRPGFHPWAHDDRSLIARADADLVRTGYAPAPAPAA